MACRHSAINIYNCPTDKPALRNRYHHLGNVFHFTNTVQQVQACSLVCILAMHRGSYHAGSYGIYPDIIYSKFSGKLKRECMDCTLACKWSCGWSAAQCMSHKRRTDVDDNSI